jgi:pyruvate formate lyase activating enzyme
MTVTEIVAEVERDLVFFDESGGGVSFTGGEPFAQPELLEALLRACRARRIHTTIETCGAVARETMLRIAGLADLILYDLKILDPARHRMYTGAGNRSILENLEALLEAGRPVTVRIPIVPGVNDDPATLRAACDYLSKLRVTSVDLLSYHAAGAEKYRRLGREYRLEQTESPTGAAMAAIAAQMAAAGIPVKIAG